MKLQNKVALITGGGGGIGRAIAVAFAGEGAKIAITDLDSDAGSESVKAVRDIGADALIVQADASLSVGDINSQNFSCTLGAGSTYTGRSGFGIEAGSRTTGTGGMLRPIAVLDEPGNDIDVSAERAFPKVEVRIVRHVDAYISADASAN